MVLDVVREAESRISGVNFMEYLPIGGSKAFNDLSVRLAYGDDAACIKEGRVAAVQSLSGTGVPPACCNAAILQKIGCRLPQHCPACACACTSPKCAVPSYAQGAGFAILGTLYALQHCCVTRHCIVCRAGSCRLMAEFMARFLPGSKIWIPKPTWSNHHKWVRQAFTVPRQNRALAPGVQFPSFSKDLWRLPCNCVRSCC